MAHYFSFIATLIIGFSKVLVLIFLKEVVCRSNNELQSVARAVNVFGDDLYKELAKLGGNIAFSPFSLHALLALLTLGTGGNTRKVMLSEIYLPNSYTLKKGYEAILRDYRNKAEQNPRISSALFVSDHYAVSESFKSIAKNFFNVFLQLINFEDHIQGAAIINKWISDATGQHISSAVNRDTFHDNSAIFLLNSIYFKGEWNLKFDKSETDNNFVFHTPTGNVRCSMMTMSHVRHNATFTRTFAYLELAFRDSDIKIGFIRPYANQDLASLENSIDAKVLFTERNNLRSTLLEIKIPKFKLNIEYSLKKPLASVGLSDIFGSPDLTNMFKRPLPAQVDAVDQNTIVEINENGAIAASVTKIQLENIPALLLVSAGLLYCVNGGERNIARSVNRFGDDLYKRLAKQEGNIVFSPFSVHSVLSLLTLGARGSTEKELLYRLYLKNSNYLRTVYSAKLQERQKTIDKNIQIANMLFYDTSLSPFNTFKTAAKNLFNVYPQKVNFSDAQTTVDMVNQWVSNKTNAGIPSMITPGTLDANTLLILINAIYFKAKWNATFNSSATINNHVFYSTKGEVKCNMMAMKQQRQKYFRGAGFQMLELAFSEADIKIVFILPAYSSTSSKVIISSLRRLERTLNYKNLFSAVRNLRLMKVDIYIPKFKLTGELFLRKHLTSMGISKIFNHPNLSAMLPRPAQAAVKGVDQKTVIEINEEGVTAAVATKIRIVTRSGYKAVFKLDSPFLFVLYDSKNDVILMKGRVEIPNS